nr:hypothetical protein [Desulfobulbaceae bacterium]
MAVIKSTLDMVLARADAMCADAPDLPDETQLNEGMKFAATFVNNATVDIAEKIGALDPAEAPMFAKGMLKTFCRFVVLPRGDDQTWQNALQGIHLLASVFLPTLPPDLGNILDELRSLLGRYKDHALQLRKQLEEQFAMQIAQMSETMSKKTGAKMNLRPDQHPKFNEEWGRVLAQLNGQYTNAIEQYKNAVTQVFMFTD